MGLNVGALEGGFQRRLCGGKIYTVCKRVMRSLRVVGSKRMGRHVGNGKSS